MELGAPTVIRISVSDEGNPAGYRWDRAFSKNYDPFLLSRESVREIAQSQISELTDE